MPEAPIPREITRLLHRWEAGDRDALASVISLVYEDLHAIAVNRREGPGHTLQATGLVNELYLRLAQVRGIHVIDRRHFYAFAAQLMPAILTDYARRSRAIRRSGSGARVPPHEQVAWVDASSEELLALAQALGQLEAMDERKVRVIDLRSFLGCTIEETAELLNISPPPSIATSPLPKHGCTGGSLSPGAQILSSSQGQLVHKPGRLKSLPQIFAPKISECGGMKTVVGERRHAGQCFSIAGFQMQWPGISLELWRALTSSVVQRQCYPNAIGQPGSRACTAAKKN
jgi:RNA polymerase sigma factor (TIGR02999 family)